MTTYKQISSIYVYLCLLLGTGMLTPFRTEKNDESKFISLYNSSCDCTPWTKLSWPDSPGGRGNKSGLFGCPAILPYGHTVLLSFCLSVTLSVCLALCISSCLSDWRFDILLTFWKTFVLISKLKSLSVCPSICRSVFLSFWHPVDILNNFCFDN